MAKKLESAHTSKEDQNLFWGSMISHREDIEKIVMGQYKNYRGFLGHEFLCDDDVITEFYVYANRLDIVFKFDYNKANKSGNFTYSQCFKQYIYKQVLGFFTGLSYTEKNRRNVEGACIDSLPEERLSGGSSTDSSACIESSMDLIKEGLSELNLNILDMTMSETTVTEMGRCLGISAVRVSQLRKALFTKLNKNYKHLGMSNGVV